MGIATPTLPKALLKSTTIPSGLDTLPVLGGVGGLHVPLATPIYPSTREPLGLLDRTQSRSIGCPEKIRRIILTSFTSHVTDVALA